jgi:hypothetical protein
MMIFLNNFNTQNLRFNVMLTKCYYEHKLIEIVLKLRNNKYSTNVDKKPLQNFVQLSTKRSWNLRKMGAVGTDGLATANDNSVYA